MARSTITCGLFAFACLALLPWIGSTQDPVKPVTVKFHEPKTVYTEANVPIDPTVRVQIQPTGGMAFGLNADGIRLTFSAGSARTMFKIDEQMVFPNTQQPMALPAKTPQGKARHGFFSSFNHGKLTITQVIEAVPTKPAKAGEKRQLDAVLVRYIVENKDDKAHKIAARVRIDTYCNTNDGALFAAPTMPDKILNGLELKEKTLPPYVQIMQNPDLKNPGSVGHFALKMGSRMIGPDRFACTSHGAGENGWEVQVVQSMGDSDCAIYWGDQVVPPKGTITLAFAYGKGLATTPESEGRMSLSFGGSFEPGKLFTIQANVDDPISNQSIDLDLPAGMELVEGKRIQQVPEPPPDSATSMVLWKCRVRELGDHTIRLNSSSGSTLTRTLTIARP